MNIRLTLSNSDLHNESHIGIINSTSRHIRSKHDLLVTSFELLSHFSTVRLRLTWVHFTHREACFTTEFSQEASHPRTDEEDHDLEVVGVLLDLVLNLTKNCHYSLFWRDNHHFLRHWLVSWSLVLWNSVDKFIVLFDSNRHYIEQVLCHCCWEEHRLPLSRQVSNNLLNWLAEAHFEHLIGFIKN